MTKAGSSHISHTDSWVQTSKGRLFVRCWDFKEAQSGQTFKAPIILFHESLGCVDLWRNFPAHLCKATGRKVIAYDRLGFGESDPYPGRISHEFIREESEIYFPALRQQLNIKDFVAFGHSVGGALAVQCAGKFQDSCQALITESAHAFMEDGTIQGILDAKRGFQKPGQIDRIEKYHGTKAEWVLNAWTETWLSPEFAKWSIEAELPKVKCPVLVIHGDADEFGSTRHPELIGRLVSGASQINILPHCRHVPHKEAEETVMKLVVEFLAKKDGNV